MNSLGYFKKIYFHHSYNGVPQEVELGFDLPRIPVAGDEFFYLGQYYVVSSVVFNIDERLIRVFVSRP